MSGIRIAHPCFECLSDGGLHIGKGIFMKTFLAFASITLTLMATSSPAHAMRVCLADGPYAENESQGEEIPVVQALFSNDAELPIEMASLQCSTYRAASQGLAVVDIGLTAATVYSACSDPAVPPKVIVTVSLGVGALVTKILKFAVDQLPCDNSKDVKSLVQEVKLEVCSSLAEGGVKCQL